MTWAISLFPFASAPKRALLRFHAYENLFHLHVHFHGYQTHFYYDILHEVSHRKRGKMVTRKMAYSCLYTT